MGSMLADWLADKSAHVICADADAEGAAASAWAVTEIRGLAPGVAGTGVSTCGLAVAAHVNLHDRESVRGMLLRGVLGYGGIDHIVLNCESPVLIEEASAVWARQGWENQLVRIDSNDVPRIPADIASLLRPNAIVPRDASWQAQAEVVMFLLSEHSSGIRSQVITLDTNREP